MSSNVEALQQTISALREMGRFEQVDAAREQMVLSMAQALDYDQSNAALWRQYREALKELTADDSSDSVDDALADLFGSVRDTPPT